MASIRIFRASTLLRGLKVSPQAAATSETSPRQAYLCRRYASTEAPPPATPPVISPPQPAQPSANETPNLNFTGDVSTSSSLPDNIKWESTMVDTSTNFLGNQVPEITGAIIPFAQQNFAQNIFFPYQYPIMHYLDLVSQHMPWWAAIVTTTATIRLLFFPLVLKINRIGIKIYNIMPETQAIQVKMNEAMLSGDNYNTALAKTKLKLLFEQHDVQVTQRLFPTLIQAPAFLCLFFTLKNLAGYHKIPAMAVGGALWFSNLTVPDPYYTLPLMTSLSMLLLFEKGLEGTTGPLNTMGPTGRWIMRSVPFALLFIFKNFPSAVLLFWTTNNFITVFYALLLRQNWAKRKFNIPERLVHDPASLPLTNQSFKGQISKSLDKAKGTRTTMDLRKLDDIAFQKAGVGPLRKTYKNPPPKRED